MQKMKDSGTIWLGQIPESWRISKISGLYKLRIQKVSDRDYKPLSVTMKGIVPQLDSAAKTNAHDDRKLVKKGDFVINSRSDRRGSCGISDYDGSVSLINTVMEPRNTMNPNYYNWLFHTVQFSDEFYKWGHGIVNDLWTTNWQDMKHIDIPVPSLSEQEKIALFLDSKCAEIDELYIDIQKQIEILEEYKKAFITETVTKGLDSDAEMKDSGIDYIGEVSKDADIFRLKFFSYMKGRIGWQGLKATDFIEVGPYCVTGTDFIDGKVNWDTCYHVSEERYAMDSNIHIQEGDLLMTKDGTIGKLAIIDKLPDKACLNSHLLIIRPLENKYTNKYLFYVMKSHIFSKYYTIVSSGSTMDSLSQEKTGNFAIPAYTIEKQKKIVEYLDEKCLDLDEAIKEKKKQLETLEEYKKSFIHEYVTGKKEVPAK